MLSKLAFLFKAFDRVWHTRLLKFLTRFGILIFFTNLSYMKFWVRCLALFRIFSVIDGFEWFRMGSSHKNIQLMLEFLRLHFWSCTIMTFLMTLSVILPLMLMILLFIVSVTRHLICGNT